MRPILRKVAWFGAALVLVAAAGALVWRSVSSSPFDLLPLSHSARVSRSDDFVAVGRRTNPAGVRSDLFGVPAPPKLPDGANGVSTALPVAPPVASGAPDPLDNFRVTGIAEINGERFACLEDRETKAGLLVKAGEKVGDATVRAVERDGIILSSAAGQRRLALNDRFDLVPLDRDAPYLGGRVTRHDDSEPGIGVRLTDSLARNGYALFALSNRLADGGEDFKKLADQAFEGKIGLQEYHDRVNAAVPQSVNVVINSFDIVGTSPANTDGLTVTTHALNLDDRP